MGRKTKWVYSIPFTIPKGKKQTLYRYFNENEAPFQATIVIYVHEEKSKNDFIIYNKTNIITNMQGKDKLFYHLTIPSSGEYIFKLNNE